MPRPRRSNLRRRPLRRQRPRREAKNQSSGMLTNVKHYARITEVVNFTQPTPNTDVNYQFNISQFVRALSLSKLYKYYRAKRVSWTYVPQYETFQIGGAGSIPQVSMIMNRTGDNTAWTAVDYDAQGAVPFSFTKKKVIAYKPNLVQAIQYKAITIAPPIGTEASQTLGARPIYDKWVATGKNYVDVPNQGLENAINGDDVSYYGHALLFYVSSVAPGSLPLGQVYCEVEWEFKDPMSVQASSLANVAVPITLDADGVAGNEAPVGAESQTS